MSAVKEKGVRKKKWNRCLYQETFLVLEKEIVAFGGGITLKKLFRVPRVEAAIVLLLDLCALFSDA